MLMYFTYNEGNTVIPERFIGNFKKKNLEENDSQC